ncbi:MAG: flagellar biosynthetic protein FliO [Acidimicrobiia bacterium]|nr:flagellar biosynthetic protein FliO [Acidimicrobiia bacterium]
MTAVGINLFTEFLPALAIVCGAPLAIWWYTRRNRKDNPGRLHVTDKAVLGKNLWVAVVNVDDKRFLVGAGESGVGLISELEALPQPVEEPAEEPVTDMNGITEQPRIGLIRRLQLMTVRSPAQNPWRSVGAARK